MHLEKETFYTDKKEEFEHWGWHILQKIPLPFHKKHQVSTRVSRSNNLLWLKSSFEATSN